MMSTPSATKYQKKNLKQKIVSQHHHFFFLYHSHNYHFPRTSPLVLILYDQKVCIFCSSAFFCSNSIQFSRRCRRRRFRWEGWWWWRRRKNRHKKFCALKIHANRLAQYCRWWWRWGRGSKWTCKCLVSVKTTSEFFFCVLPSFHARPWRSSSRSTYNQTDKLY